jgi:hypothetical protein
MSILLDTPIKIVEVPYKNEEARLFLPRKEKSRRKQKLSLFYQKRWMIEKKLSNSSQKNVELAKKDLSSLSVKIEALRLQLHNMVNQKGFLISQLLH